MATVSRTHAQRSKVYKRDIVPLYDKVVAEACRLSPAGDPSELDERGELFKMILYSVMGDLHAIAIKQDDRYAILTIEEFAALLVSNWNKHADRQRVIDEMKRVAHSHG
jgi:hypothetical protein